MYVEAVTSQTATGRITPNQESSVKKSVMSAENNFANNSVKKPAMNSEKTALKNEKSTDGFAQPKEITETDRNEADSLTMSEIAEADAEKIKKVMEGIREQLPNAEAKFGIHEDTQRIMIKLVDKDTQKIIKEFPPEKVLDLLAKSLELAGVLVDEKL